MYLPDAQNLLIDDLKIRMPLNIQVETYSTLAQTQPTLAVP